MIFEKLLCEDLNEIIPIYIEAFNNEPWNDKWTKETVFKRLSDMINTPGYYGLKVYDENKIIGGIIGHSEQYYDGVHFSIKELFISKNIQGKGYGSKILDYVLKDLKDKNIKNVNLLTYNSLLTIGFYEKSDFKLDDKIQFMVRQL